MVLQSYLVSAGRSTLKSVGAKLSSYIKQWIEMDAMSRGLLKGHEERLKAIARYAFTLGNTTARAQNASQRSRASEGAGGERGVLFGEDDVRAVVAHARPGFLSVYSQLQSLPQPTEPQWRQLQLFLIVWAVFALLGQRSEFYRHLLVSELQKTQSGTFS